MRARSRWSCVDDCGWKRSRRHCNWLPRPATGSACLPLSSSTATIVRPFQWIVDLTVSYSKSGTIGNSCSNFASHTPPYLDMVPSDNRSTSAGSTTCNQHFWILHHLALCPRPYGRLRTKLVYVEGDESHRRTLSGTHAGRGAVTLKFWIFATFAARQHPANVFFD